MFLGLKLIFVGLCYQICIIKPIKEASNYHFCDLPSQTYVMQGNEYLYFW